MVKKMLAVNLILHSKDRHRCAAKRGKGTDRIMHFLIRGRIQYRVSDMMMACVTFEQAILKIKEGSKIAPAETL
jgi:hypothetical protein